MHTSFALSPNAPSDLFACVSDPSTLMPEVVEPRSHPTFLSVKLESLA